MTDEPRKRSRRATVAAGAPATATCEECGNEFNVRPSGQGRRALYCSGRCRTAAYRKRQAPGAAELREAIAAQLATPVHLQALRATLPDLDAEALAEMHRHLDVLLRAWDHLKGLGGVRAVSPEPADVDAPAPVTHTPPAVGETAAPRPAAPAMAGRSIGGLTPTAEQAAILDACVTGRNLIIEAGAGTGKTSTLKMAGKVMAGKNGMYIAFNRAIAREAARSFPRNVSCSTAHSLAFRAVGHAYKQRLDGPRLPAKKTAELLNITEPLVFGPDRRVEPTQIARLAMDTVAGWCRTADPVIGAQHVPEVNGIDGAAAEALAAEVVPLAKLAWEDLRKVDGKLRFQHDHYLKMWALTSPKLGCDFLLFDEAQDADPLIASVVQSQDCQLIAVGDSQQAIYGWRGAVNAIETWPAQQRLYLTQSWRFGPAVADEANKWLQLLGARLRLTGTPTVPSRLASLPDPKAVLCRTNGEAIAQAMAAMDAGRRAALLGGGAAIKRLAQAAKDLQQGRSTDHPELFAFTNWGEVQEYVKDDSAGRDLATLVKLVDDHGADEIINAADRLSSDRYADVIISTAHKAKGAEWDTVKIGRDFRQPKADETGRPGKVPKGEAMLAYVAVTRAKRVLDRGGLDWIDDQLAGRSAGRMRDTFVGLDSYDSDW